MLRSKGRKIAFLTVGLVVVSPFVSAQHAKQSPTGSPHLQQKSAPKPVAASGASTTGPVVYGQKDNRTDTNDEVARFLIDMERQWLEANITHDPSILERILADDYQIMRPTGRFSTKSEEIAHVKASNPSCKLESDHLDDAKVRVFGDVAVLYGWETFVRKCTDKVKTGTYFWSDVWLKRNGRWQAVAGIETPPTEVSPLLPPESKPVAATSPRVSPRLAALQKQLEAGNRSALESFWKEVTNEGTPIVEAIPGDGKHVLVTFLWRGGDDIKNFVLFSPVGARYWDFSRDQLVQSQLTHLADTNVWYKTCWLRKDARFSYLLSPNDSLVPSAEVKDWNERRATWQLDPLNRRRWIFPKVDGDANSRETVYSIVELSGPPRSWSKPQPGVLKGRVELHQFTSKILGNERRVWVYTPPDYSPSSGPYHLLVLFDGWFQKEVLRAPNVLDNLLAKGAIPPLVAVMFGNRNLEDRLLNLGCYPPFNQFLAQELIPWIRQNYRVTSDPAQIIVGGGSRGGLAAAFAALQHPEIFGNVYSQAGYFSWKAGDADTEEENEENDADYGWLIRRYVENPKLPIRFYLAAGLLERGEGGLLIPNRHMRDVLQAKGYVVGYKEFSGGHDILPAEENLVDGLLFLTAKEKPGTASGASTTGPGGLPLRAYKFDVVTVNSSGRVTKRRKGQARYYVEDISGVALEMVEISGGTFLMGNTEAGADQVKREYERHGHNAEVASKQSRWEVPQHTVSVPTFYMGKFEVTQAQWRAVCELPKVNKDLVCDLSDLPHIFKGDSLPAQQVSWEDAIEFCERLSRATDRTYRLPTEAEWEYAARGGTTTVFHFGDTITPEVVNYDGNYPYGSAPKGTNRQTTTPVGSLGYPNAFGLYDMHGNVWEWCMDSWHESYNGAPTDGSSWETAGDTGRRVLRGGSYYHDANHCRAAMRAGALAPRGTPSTGFRLVAVAPTQ